MPGGYSWASPHARGSTLAGVATLARFPGFPACAGIDLVPALHRPHRPGLPRMRGDRPFLPSIRSAISTASPHARGSTFPFHLLTRGVKGFPACAGIDLLPRGWICFGPRLPRMRGDRPEIGRDRPEADEASPHARGSTCNAGVGIFPVHGFPACAGIDPIGAPGMTRRRGLPRMRGDRPCLGWGGSRRRQASPHARGSTVEPGGQAAPA